MAENLIRDTIQAVTFSSDTQVADVTQELVRLLENGWKIDANSSGIEKVYHFEKSRRRIVRHITLILGYQLTEVKFFDAIVNEISGFKQHHPTLTSVRIAGRSNLLC